MQYLLTEQECQKMQETIELAKKKNLETIQKLCVEVAQNKPILFWGNKQPEIWGCCIHGDDENHGYCDNCPVKDVCPEPHKAWSR